MAANIHDKHYKSDDINSGRKIKKFLQQICEDAIHEHNIYLQEHNKCYKYYDSPLFFNEKNCSYIFNNAIRKQTAMLLPEVPVDRKNRQINDTNNGFCDAWCHCNDIHYFIEYKHGWYNIGERSSEALGKHQKTKITTMVEQLRNIKNGSTWKEYTNNGVFLGIMPIIGYFHKNQSPIYSYEDILNEVYESINKSLGAQILVVSEEVPEDVQKSMECDGNYINKFVAILCIAISTKKS